MSSGYFNQFGVDLDGWFGPLGLGLPTHPVNYQVAGVDLNQRYFPLVPGGIQMPPTGFFWHGIDLNEIFGWPPITPVGLEVHLLQFQGLDGGIVINYDESGSFIENKYYAGNSIGFIYGDAIPSGATIQPSLPNTSTTSEFPAFAKNGSTQTALSFRINNNDGTYSSLLSKYPTAQLNVLAATPRANMALIGDTPNGYTAAAASVSPLETNSSVSFQIIIPPTIPGNPNQLLFFGTVQAKAPREIVPLFFATGVTGIVGGPQVTAAGSGFINSPVTAISNASWVTDSNIIDLSVNASFSARIIPTPTQPTVGQAQALQSVQYAVGLNWGIDPTNLFAIETTTVERTSTALTPVYDWTVNGQYQINAYSRGAFVTGPVWTPGTTTDDITLTPSLLPAADPSAFLTGQVLICQSLLAAQGNKLDILGDYYIVDTSAMDKFAFSDSGTLQYTGS